MQETSTVARNFVNPAAIEKFNTILEPLISRPYNVVSISSIVLGSILECRMGIEHLVKIYRSTELCQSLLDGGV